MNNPAIERLDLIDTLRGFALLGLLFMNTISFAMPLGAYVNPYAYLGDSWLNLPLYYLTHSLVDQKFMGIFSILFGVSALLFLNSTRHASQTQKWQFFKRNMWLVVFGLAHGILVFKGDILLVYGLCGFVVYSVRKLSVTLLLSLGAMIYLLPNLYFIDIQSDLANLSASDLAGLKELWQPSQQSIAQAIEVFRGSYGSQLLFRLDGGPNVDQAGRELFVLYVTLDGFGRALGLMLVGMGLYKAGVFSRHYNRALLYRLLVLGLAMGLPLIAWGAYQNILREYEASYGLFVGRIYNNIATPFVVMSYLCVFHLWMHSTRFNRFKSSLSAVGKLALTNYLMQSIIGNVIFYGWGLGWYGYLSRAEVYALVLVIAAGQIGFSVLWLTRFRQGPVEWLLKRLVRGRPAPASI